MNGAPCEAARPSFRPGGFDITDRALAFCSFAAGSRLLDLGCGPGATVRHVRRDYGYAILGLDRDEAFADEEEGIVAASAEAIPLPDAAMDGILMECSLSVMGSPEAALDECRRVLKPGGRLIVSDLYARGEAAILQGCLGRVEKRETICSAIARAGFAIELFEDFSERLVSMWAQIVFDRGAAAFYAEIGADCATLKAVQCGYCLVVARKERP